MNASAIAPPVRGVVFDLDDTLHDDTDASCYAAAMTAAAIAGQAGCSADELRRAYLREAGVFWHGLTPATLGTSIANLRARMWGAALVACGADDAFSAACAVEYDRRRNERLRLFPGTLALLRNLRARGCRLALLTNGFSETHREKIVRLALADAFDALLIADEIGMVKPDPAVFRHACAAIGTVPAETAMVGDRYDRDCAGALGIGMRAVLLKVREEAIPPGAPPPTAIVTRIEEVEAVLFAEASATG